MPCYELEYHPECVPACTQCSQDRLQIHYNPEQDKVVPDDEWMNKVVS